MSEDPGQGGPLGSPPTAPNPDAVVPKPHDATKPKEVKEEKPRQREQGDHQRD